MYMPCIIMKQQQSTTINFKSRHFGGRKCKCIDLYIYMCVCVHARTSDIPAFRPPTPTPHDHPTTHNHATSCIMQRCELRNQSRPPTLTIIAPRRFIAIERARRGTIPMYSCCKLTSSCVPCASHRCWLRYFLHRLYYTIRARTKLSFSFRIQLSACRSLLCCLPR